MSARDDSYRGIAGHYDLHMMDWWAQTYGGRLQTLLDQRGLTGSKVLDAGCGTGTLALALAKKGYRVTGVDLSAGLLDVARRKDVDQSVRWLHGDITTLDLGETFDVITSVADVLNHLETLDAWERAFRSFAAHLRPGGTLLFDVMTCRGLELLDAYSTQDRADRTLIIGSIWEPATRRSTMKITSFMPSPASGLWERASDTIAEWGQSVQDVYDRLSRAGFDAPERPWKAGEDPEAEERLVALARRLDDPPHAGTTGA